MTHAEDLPDLHKLWNYQKPDETEKTFRDLLPRAEASGDKGYTLQLWTQIARALGLQGKFDAAHKVLDDVEKELTDKTRVARVRCLLERGRVFNSSRHPDKARPLFEKAWDLGREYRTDDYAVDAAHMMAIVAAPEDKLAWNIKAMERAEQSDEPRARGWLGTLYNNIGWDYHEQGEYAKALEVHRKCLEVHEARDPQSSGTRIARWSVAKQLRCLGRADEALQIQRELEKNEPDGFVFEEIGECLLLQKKEAAARPYFKKAYDLLKEIAWVAEDTKRMERLEELSGG